jgi:hypothetical protein
MVEKVDNGYSKRQRRLTIMDITKRLIAILLCALLCAPAAPAQDSKAPSQANNPTAQDGVAIIIQQEQVRFTTQKAVQMMQLQVFNPSGETIFDSGPVSAGEINWAFQNANGEEFKSGVYAYTLSIHESGAAEARVRRGHFIVDLVKDRDGKTDKLWVTSQNEDGVGAELTVARNEAGVVAGTKTGAAALLAEEIPEGQVVKSLNGLTDNVTLEAGTNVAITPEGNTLKIDAQIADGQVVKGLNGLTDQVTLEAGPNITITPNGNTMTIASTGAGYSSITELNGNIGIGTESPVSKLDVRGWFTLDTGTSPVLFTAADGGEQNRFLQLINSPVHRSASGLKAGGVLVADDYNFAQPGKNNLIVKGTLGIGTPTPASELHIRGLNPFITLSTAAGANAYIQNSGGHLVFKPTGSGYSTAAMVMQANTLNVGIGSTNPQAKLEVASGSGDILRLIGYEPFITLFDSHHGYTPTYIQNAGGSIVFKPSGFGSCCAAMVMQATTGNVGIGTSAPQAKLDVVGQTRTQSLQITGGADFAENFDVNVETTGDEELAAKVEAGMVVSIDPTSPGKLRLSAHAYDRRVAGIISGAGGVKPGMMMSQEGTLADGKHPVALSGRVYCWVDASQGAVEPGDLLTTSSTPGHAMKATDPAKAQGAIIGKAMTGLKEGKGLALVLITLQ